MNIARPAPGTLGGMMRRHCLVALCLSLFALVGLNSTVHSQESTPPPPPADNASASDLDNDTVFRVNVDMVQLNVAVIDRKGNYVTGLHPSDFAIVEDSIPQKLATFEEGNQEPIMLVNPSQPATNPAASSVTDSRPRTSASPQFSSAGANVFILFDTSNYMYRGFVFAQDAISDFVRSLDSTAKIAFYSYSRDIARDALLTTDRSQVLRGVRSTVAGGGSLPHKALVVSFTDGRPPNGALARLVL